MSSDAISTILVWLTSDDFTRQGKSPGLKRVKEIQIKSSRSSPRSSPLLG